MINPIEINNDSNFFEYIIYIIKTLINKIAIIENENIITIENSINVSLTQQGVDRQYWSHVFKSESERDYLVKLGEIQAEKFVTNRKIEDDTDNKNIDNVDNIDNIDNKIIDNKIIDNKIIDIIDNKIIDNFVNELLNFPKIVLNYLYLV